MENFRPAARNIITPCNISFERVSRSKRFPVSRQAASDFPIFPIRRNFHQSKPTSVTRIRELFRQDIVFTFVCDAPMKNVHATSHLSFLASYQRDYYLFDLFKRVSVFIFEAILKNTNEN